MEGSAPRCGQRARKYFGTDGVRGLANEDLTPLLVYRIARIATHHLLQRYPGRRSIVVGSDPRWSSPLLEHALLAGILSIGGEAIQVGVVPTPAVAFATRYWNAAGGVMLSASHNHFADNGVKFFDGNGCKLDDTAEALIEDALHNEATEESLPVPTGKDIGRTRTEDAAPLYLQYLCEMCPLRLQGLRIVLDTANGAASFVGPELLRRLGAEVISIGDAPDGTNINHQVGSTHPQTLQAAVQTQQADLGFALDGDGDRLLAVDSTGSVWDGDDIIALCAQHLSTRGLLAQQTVVTTVMSNGGLAAWLQTQGISTQTTDVGDRRVIEAMQAGGYSLGGETSGHIVFAECSTTGDGLLTALQILRAMSDADQSLHQLRPKWERRPQELINVPLPNGAKDAWKQEAQFVQCLQEAEAALVGSGRVLIRPSGTEPLLRVMVEAATTEQATDWAEKLAHTLQKVL